MSDSSNVIATMAGSGLKKGLTIGTTIIVVGGVAYAGYKLYKKGKASVTSSSSNDSEKTRAVTYDNMTYDVAKLTLNQNTLNLIVDNIYSSMSGAGTDEATLLSNLAKLTTYNDMTYAIKQFGMKRYLWWGRSEYVGEKLNMTGWILKELKGDNLAKAKAIYKKANVSF